MSEKQVLLTFVKKNLLKKSQKITANSLLFEGRYLDSMNILSLIGYVEKRIGRRLSDEEIVMNNFKSVKAIAQAFFHES